MKRGCARERAASSGRQFRTVLLLACSHLSSNFSSEVVNWLLDAITYFEVSEGNDFSAGFLGQIADLDFRVLDERLLNQAGFSQELADTTGNHFFNDFGWLAFDLVFVEAHEHGFFAFDGISGNLRRQQELRVACSYVHGDVTSQLSVAAFQSYNNTDLVAVQVSINNVTFDAGQTTDVDVLAYFTNQNQTISFLSSDQRSCVGQFVSERFFNAVSNEFF